MPTAVTHVLFAIIAIDLFRDHVIKDKRKIPLHYVFLGGVAGLLPDIDIPIYWLFNNILGMNFPWIHRVFTHTLVFVLMFLLAALILYDFNKRWSLLAGIFTFGIAFHIFLDWFFVGGVQFFYPMSLTVYSFDLIGMLDFPVLLEGMEAIILLWWLWHEEKTHKISDFI
jgi:membrane-bound metal-dependent hydrolase YbcI (DUF457 family)